MSLNRDCTVHISRILSKVSDSTEHWHYIYKILPCYLMSIKFEKKIRIAIKKLIRPCRLKRKLFLGVYQQ